MIIDCISDLHGAYPKLEGGDLLVVAGDLTGRDESNERVMFLKWLADQNYRKKIWIAGNHDNSLIGLKFDRLRPDSAEYLCDSGTEFEGLKIWGSPWTKQFEGMNPHCMAFTVKSEEELAKKWELIPVDTNILITHSPPYGILDKVANKWKNGVRVGSHCLLTKLNQLNHLKLHVFGHIHSGYGHEVIDKTNMHFVNASHMNEDYEPVNKPIRIIL